MRLPTQAYLPSRKEVRGAIQFEVNVDLITFRLVEIDRLQNHMVFFDRFDLCVPRLVPPIDTTTQDCAMIMSTPQERSNTF
jgi:hypothetical protein